MAQESRFLQGMRDGIPIALGYFPVSFAFGMQAVQSGLPVWVPLIISMTNLTSAGQFAGLSVILSGGAYLELAVTTLIVNLRYMLMSLALSQKVPTAMPLRTRCGMAFGITDEIFAVSMQQKGDVTGRYFAGLLSMPYLGWAAGTLFGGIATSLLPQILQNALGITIYGMFLAIIIPPARKSNSILAAILIAAAISCLFYYVPFLSAVSSGWVIIIASVAASLVCALLFPITDEEGST